MKLKFRSHKLPASLAKRSSKGLPILSCRSLMLVKNKYKNSLQIQEVITHFYPFCPFSFFDIVPPRKGEIRRKTERKREKERSSLISRYPHGTSAQETNWISLPRHANDRIPFPRLEVVGAMHLLARSSGGRSRRRHSSENRITAAVERVPFPRVLSAKISAN